VDQTLQHIKAALIYKGVDFGIVFAEVASDDSKPARGRGKSTSSESED